MNKLTEEEYSRLNQFVNLVLRFNNSNRCSEFPNSAILKTSEKLNFYFKNPKRSDLEAIKTLTSIPTFSSAIEKVGMHHRILLEEALKNIFKEDGSISLKLPNHLKALVLDHLHSIIKFHIDYYDFHIGNGSGISNELLQSHLVKIQLFLWESPFEKEKISQYFKNDIRKIIKEPVLADYFKLSILNIIEGRVESDWLKKQYDEIRRADEEKNKIIKSRQEEIAKVIAVYIFAIGEYFKSGHKLNQEDINFPTFKGSVIQETQRLGEAIFSDIEYFRHIGSLKGRISDFYSVLNRFSNL